MDPFLYHRHYGPSIQNFDNYSPFDLLPVTAVVCELELLERKEKYRCDSGEGDYEE